ncbi:MAG: hypothetical protein JXA58_07755 [Dehalococcoidia bacterium]|nr:hypothetical protein [Dehalococcoidia bacterium]
MRPTLFAYATAALVYISIIVATDATRHMVGWGCYRSSLLTSDGREALIHALCQWDTIVRATTMLSFYWLDVAVVIMLAGLAVGQVRASLVVYASMVLTAWALLGNAALVEFIAVTQSLAFNEFSLGAPSKWCPWPGRIGPGIQIAAQVTCAAIAVRSCKELCWMIAAILGASVVAFGVAAVLQGMTIGDWIPFVKLVYA